MIAIVSGEGPTDIGRCENAQDTCQPPDFVLGAMGAVVDVLLKPVWKFSPVERSRMCFVSKSALAERSRSKTKLAFPGKKKRPETAYFFKNAFALAAFAMETERREKCKTLAVLFRDTDGTASTEKGMRRKKVDSMRQGFEAAGYQRGVPMMPKPKSEAWLLCALQKRSYQHCERFEDISGNDDSPKSAKKQLNAALSARREFVGDLPEMVRDGRIEPSRVCMSSFDEFRQRLEEVARDMMH